MARLYLLLLLMAAALKSQSLLQQGLQALQSGDLASARTALESASRSDQTNPIVWSALAQVYFRSQQPALAAAAAAAAEKNARGNPLVFHALAMYYSEAAEFPTAARLEQQFAASPNADRGASLRAVAFYLKANDPHSALSLAKTAAQANPETAFNLAQAFLQRQDFTPAAELLQFALDRFPSDAQLTLAMGVARYGQRRFDDAITFFLKVIDLDPTIDQPYTFIGRMLDQAGPRLPRIQALFLKRAQQNPSDAKAQFLLAKVLLTADSKDPHAQSLLRKSINLDNARWESHYELGALLAAEHNYPEAAVELSHSIELNPNQAVSHYQLARVYDRLGQPEHANQERAIHHNLIASGNSAMQ